MYLDDLPDLARARAVRAAARGAAIRDGGRAVAVAFVSDGARLAADTLVRFDVTVGEDPARRLADAFATTGARALWFYGGDDGARRAVTALGLELRPAGAALVRRMDAPSIASVALREPVLHDRVMLATMQQEHAPDFTAPQALVAEAQREAIGVAFMQTLDDRWTELRVAVHPQHRGNGWGTSIAAAAADRLESAGRRVCAAVEETSGIARTMLERAGFRLADYYFIAKRVAE